MKSKSSRQWRQWQLDLRWLIAVAMISLFHHRVQAQAMGDAVDVSQDFQKMEQVYFIGDRVVGFDPATGKGTLEWFQASPFGAMTSAALCARFR